MKTKDFFTRDEEYARMKAIILLVSIIFVTGLVTNTFGTEVGIWYLVAIFGSFAVISIGLIYHYREEPEEAEDEGSGEPDEEGDSEDVEEEDNGEEDSDEEE